jgi:pimeloyl-ACP methyl ester carboxylesterase
MTSKVAIDERRLEARLQHVEINGNRLAYLDVGAGEPVVLVHGGLSDVTTWEPLLDTLAQHYRVIAYSQRYAWPNEPIGVGVVDTITQHASDLATLIEKLQIGPAHLVGSSWGGFVVLVVARDRPQLVRSLVVQEAPVIPLFLGAPPRPPALLKTLVTRPRVGRALARMVFKGMVPAKAAIKRGAVDQSIEIILRRAAFGDAGYQELPDWAKHHMSLNTGTHVSQFLNDGGFVAFTARDARSIRHRTLVLTGAQSPAGQKVLAGELARLLPAAEEVEIPQASHMAHLVNPEATAEAIIRFLGQGGSGGGTP